MTEKEIDDLVEKFTSPDYEYGEHRPVDAYELAHAVAALVAAHEREQCALVCEQHQEGGIGGWKHNTPMDCAIAIRAMGTA